MSPGKHTTGEFTEPDDPGLQLVLYRLGKIEDRQERGEVRDANVMGRLDQIVATLNDTRVALATGAEKFASHTRDIQEARERMKKLEDEQSGLRKIIKDVRTVQERPVSSVYHRRAGIDHKFWTILSTALAALCTAIAAIVGWTPKDSEHPKQTTDVPINRNQR